MSAPLEPPDLESRRLLDELLALADDDRSAPATCGATSDKHASRARAAMDAAARTPQFLEPPRRASRDLQHFAAATDLPVFGAYRAVTLLGIGGVGAVYRAERAAGPEAAPQPPGPRIVAIKALRAEMAAAANIERLYREAEALRRLSHTDIAKLHEVGVTSAGRPYLVMEYVEGVTLREYLSRQSLPLRDRLRLLCLICDAVQYAHERLIVHRDLKPANIAITPAGDPKLLDFGLARILEPGLPAHATRTIYRAMTPGYASPEQLRGEPAATPSDVYSLGVILYEMVTGRLPVEPQETIAETLATVMRSALRPPSLVCAEAGRDLDAITLRALSPEPEHRYGSAVELADDVRSLLEGRPVRARRPTRRYLLGRWAQRHATAVAVASALFAGLVVACGVSVGLAVSLARSSAQAESARQTSDRISAALARVIESAEAMEGEGAEPSAGALLDAAAARVDQDVEGDLAAEAAVRLTLGRGYGRMGRLNEAAGQFELALAAAEAGDGLDESIASTAMHELGRVLAQLGATNRAEPLLRRALAARRAIAGHESAPVAETLAALAACDARRGDRAEALAQYSAAIDIWRRAGAETEAVGPLTQRARLLTEEGDHDGARQNLLEAMKINRRQFGDQSGQTAATLADLARAAAAAGRAAEAEQWARRALTTATEVYSADHPTTTWQMLVLAQIIELTRPEEAEALMEEAVDVAAGSLGERHYITAYCRMEYGRVLTSAGRYEEAERHLMMAKASCDALFGAESPNTVAAGRLLAELERARDR